MKHVVCCFLSGVLILSCNLRYPKTSSADISQLAEKYVRLALDIGRYDSSFVDAYYGPDSLKASGLKKQTFPKDSFLLEVQKLQDAFSQSILETKNDTIRRRANWMKAQLTAFGRRIKIFSGEYASFDEESVELYGAAAPVIPESHYQALVTQLDGVLPGKGAISERFQLLANRFVIPKIKLDTVFHVAIAECRKRTLEHYSLPPTENFNLEFVTEKPWSGYNWYKGNYQSLIQINTDLQIFINRAIDVGCHESYPGHHVYNVLLEKNFYRDKNWVENSLYALFSPQSLIAEGSANYGINLVFPDNNSKVAFSKEVLLPLTGLDTTGITSYFQALAIRGQLDFARNEVGRGIVNKTMDSITIMRWLNNYGLMNEETAQKSIRFINVNRSYIINYNYGMELIKSYVEAKSNDDSSSENRWETFGELLSNPILPSDLIERK
ncbi:MAG: hypothetical protein ABIO76_09645 [Ginsengibacter sp.]